MPTILLVAIHLMESLEAVIVISAERTRDLDRDSAALLLLLSTAFCVFLLIKLAVCRWIRLSLCPMRISLTVPPGVSKSVGNECFVIFESFGRPIQVEIIGVYYPQGHKWAGNLARKVLEQERIQVR